MNRPVVFKGIVQQVTPQSVIVTTASGPVVVPRSQVFRVAGTQVTAAQLRPDSPVTVTILPERANIVAVSNSVITLQTSEGITQVPVSSLSPAVLQGTIVNVPAQPPASAPALVPGTTTGMTAPATTPPGATPPGTTTPLTTTPAPGVPLIKVVHNCPPGQHVIIDQKVRVDVLLANGNVINVPLNAALHQQRAQDAFIIGIHPHEPRRVAGQEGNERSFSTKTSNDYFGQAHPSTNPLNLPKAPGSISWGDLNQQPRGPATKDEGLPGSPATVSQDKGKAEGGSVHASSISMNGKVVDFDDKKVVLQCDNSRVEVPRHLVEAKEMKVGHDATFRMSGNLRMETDAKTGNVTCYDDSPKPGNAPQTHVSLPGTSRVDLVLGNGNVINIPLNAALNIVRAQGDRGAEILLDPAPKRPLPGNESNPASAGNHPNNPYNSGLQPTATEPSSGPQGGPAVDSPRGPDSAPQGPAGTVGVPSDAAPHGGPPAGAGNGPSDGAGPHGNGPPDGAGQPDGNGPPDDAGAPDVSTPEIDVPEAPQVETPEAPDVAAPDVDIPSDNGPPADPGGNDHDNGPPAGNPGNDGNNGNGPDNHPNNDHGNGNGNGHNK